MSTVMLGTVMRSHPTAVPRWVMRSSAVVAAVAAALVIRVGAELALGLDLRAPSFDPAAQALPVRVQDVLLVSALLSLAGCGFIVFLERLTARARGEWL